MNTDRWLEAVERRISADAERRHPSIRALTVLFDPGCAPATPVRSG